MIRIWWALPMVRETRFVIRSPGFDPPRVHQLDKILLIDYATVR